MRGSIDGEGCKHTVILRLIVTTKGMMRREDSMGLQDHKITLASRWHLTASLIPTARKGLKETACPTSSPRTGGLA